MQPVSWYLHRLKSMSATEILWRFNALGMAQMDRMRVACGLLPEPTFIPQYSRDQLRCGDWRVCDHQVGCWRDDSAPPPASQWLDRLRDKADRVAERKLSYFDLVDVVIGDGEGWHTDHSSKITAPLDPINAIDYRDVGRVGDCKLVWEPNRHHQLVILGRAYRATGDIKYARALVEQLQSWMRANPFGRGMNWRSPLELGVRVINWVWAIDLTWESGLYTGDFQQQLTQCVYRHCRDIARKLSKGSSANNHLVGEAAGLYVAAAYFDGFEESQKWCGIAKEILEREIFAQSYNDGCTREQALGYQFFVIQFYLIAALIGRRKGEAFSQAYWRRLELMISFIAKLSEGGADLPMFGDRDDGYVVDLGDRVDDTNALMSLAAELFENDSCSRLAKRASETAFWLLGQYGRETARESDPLSSCQLGDSGYYLLQYGSLTERNKVSVLFDCAELGYKSIAAHGHADALSFSLRINDLDCLVDPGTYDYFTHPEWRNYFRSTRAHNTLEVDGTDQSEMLGPFLWGAKANARCLAWRPSEGGGHIEASHDGYGRLSDPVIHSRALDLKGDRRELTLVDKVTAKAGHDIALYFHFSEHCRMRELTGNLAVLDFSGGSVALQLDERLEVAVLEGSVEPKGGWLSRGYHRKQPIVTLVARGKIAGDDQFTSCITW